MKWTHAAGLAAVVLAGCQSLPPGAEPGPHHTMAFDVGIETSSPARIEVNGQDMGQAPLHIKIFGDPDGTFHDFGSYYYVIRAVPASTNAFAQMKVYRTGHMMTPEDHIPSKIYFDMSRPAPAYPPPEYYYAPPPAYYAPDPYYYGPDFHFYIGPGYYHRHRW